MDRSVYHPTANNCGIKFPSYRLRSIWPVCAICGRVHFKIRFIGILSVLLVLSSFTLPAQIQSYRSSSTGLISKIRADEEQPGLPTVILGIKDNTPTPNFIPTPTVAVPNDGVIWNRKSTGIYLWNEPGGSIDKYLENGLIVELHENWRAYGGAPFGEVSLEGEMGWVDMRSVHRIWVPLSGFNKLQADSGKNLYDRPQGNKILWLPKGTPYLSIARNAHDNWAEIVLLIGGQTGWIQMDDR